jgi:hypothetical protein
MKFQHAFTVTLPRENVNRVQRAPLITSITNLKSVLTLFNLEPRDSTCSPDCSPLDLTPPVAAFGTLPISSPYQDTRASRTSLRIPNRRPARQSTTRNHEDLRHVRFGEDAATNARHTAARAIHYAARDATGSGAAVYGRTPRLRS